MSFREAAAQEYRDLLAAATFARDTVVGPDRELVMVLRWTLMRSPLGDVKLEDFQDARAALDELLAKHNLRYLPFGPFL